MSRPLLLLLFSHLILVARAEEERPAPKGSPGARARGRSSAPQIRFSSSSAALRGGGGSLRWSPAGRRTGSLYCTVGIGFHLQIYPGGQVNGSHEASPLSALEMFAVSQGIVGIRGVFSNKFLAMSRKGKLHASARFTDECKFRERFQENSYNTYASAVYRTAQTGREWYVALNKRGKAKRGCSPRVKPQHVSTHFLPRIQQPKLPELSFTVTVPEKKKPPAALPKPKVSVTASQKSTRPVRYKLKFRFG
uniref:Fibroblast growth factor n=1 Tax=Geotrypetes seraphini TaxID=260995 RepID=A0A6P8RCK9_GEOSA|nr:fibroblast growth factor 5 isoform X1 [Geotrypetes seraphini]